ncbi:MAG: hypothetical protein JWO95_2375, partial [Verrucomicrobiales bacterium]|nr:hypothetical protein [Verrucomicrobiales bacterium]
MKLWIFLFAAVSAFTSIAANDGSEVAVVFNSAMPESKAVAEHYASVRNVPASQVFGLDLPRTEVISRAQYRDQLQNPLLKGIEKQNLFTFKRSKVSEATIRYIVLCYGVPLRIAADTTLSEKAESKLKPEERNNGAAVDSELATLPSIYQKLPLTGSLSNPAYRTTNSAALNPTNGIIMVARLDGPTPEIARALVDKAVQAERDGLWGRAYIDMRGLTNGAYAPTDTNFLIAAEVAKRAGYETVVDTNMDSFPTSFPLSQIALYAGWVDEKFSGPLARPNVEFMPGAFAYALHSYDALTLRSTTSHWAGPLLARGATATMGAVDEPFMDGLPDMSIFFTRWLLLHMTYGEAAYSSFMTVSWQGTVIGDPLYNPFRKPAEQRHQELASRGSKLIDWSHLSVVNINLALGTPVAELVKYLNAEPVTKTSAILSEKLGDFYQYQGKPESSIHAYRQALKLEPSPQQEVRLRLSLIEKLKAAGKNEEASSELEAFRKKFPDYSTR